MTKFNSESACFSSKHSQSPPQSLSTCHNGLANCRQSTFFAIATNTATVEDGDDERLGILNAPGGDTSVTVLLCTLEHLEQQRRDHSQMDELFDRVDSI